MPDTKFTWDDRVIVRCTGEQAQRNGACAWIVGVTAEPRQGKYYEQFPPGAVYSVEFEDGMALEIHEGDLIRFEGKLLGAHSPEPIGMDAETKETGQETREWSISASSGRQRMACRVLSPGRESGTLVGSIHITGQFWQRDRAIAEAAMAPDFEVLLPQVVLDLRALEALRLHLLAWPANPGRFRCELGSPQAAAQRLSLSFGMEAELISSAEKPACRIDYQGGPSMAASWAFVVDQSCIRLAGDELGAVLRACRSPGGHP